MALFSFAQTKKKIEHVYFSTEFKLLFKRRLLLFFLFLVILILFFSFSFLFSNAIPFLGFFLFLILFLSMDLSDLSYAHYCHSIAKKPLLQLAREKNSFYFLAFFSFIVFVSVGALMNIPLQSPHWDSYLVQLILLVMFFYILHEFWFAYLLSKGDRAFSEGSHTSVRNQYSLSIKSEIFGIIIRLVWLFFVAWGLPSPHNYLSLGLLAVVSSVGIYYGVKTFRAYY